MSNDRRTKRLAIDRLLIATGNAGKAAELSHMLSVFEIEVVDLGAFPEIGAVEETGSTFAQNAELKASNYAIASGLFALADDSGLQVNELDGLPGVHSARFGGVGLSDRDRIAKLLREMKGIPVGRRNARFTAAVSLAKPNGKIVRTFHGHCYGSIAAEPRGEHGFGYDPIFIPENFRRTFGELSGDAKSTLSHRAQAVAKLIEFLPDFTGV